MHAASLTRWGSKASEAEEMCALTGPRMPPKHHTSMMWSQGVPFQVAIRIGSTHSVLRAAYALSVRCLFAYWRNAQPPPMEGSIRHRGRGGTQY